MKKTYVKPNAIFESFELSANIAGDCEFTTNHQLSVCPYEIKSLGGNVFIDATTSCYDITAPDGQYNGVCYQVPSTANNLFTS